MKYRLVTLEPFTILCKKKVFFIDAEENLIPAFWQEQKEIGLFPKLLSHSVDSGFYGACHQVDSNSNSFEYGIGVKVENDMQVDDLESWHIKNPLWAVFECESVNHIGQTWDYIIKDFFLNTQFERVETLDYEYYPHDRDDIFCELYIPIKRKN